jgi:hypothetical protein
LSNPVAASSRFATLSRMRPGFARSFAGKVRAGCFAQEATMKGLIQFVSIAAACLLLLAPVGCKSTLPQLVGTYSIMEDGKLTEFVRIEQVEKKFSLSEKDGGRWLTPTSVKEVDDDDIENIIGQPVSSNITAIGNYSVAVVQVHKGWKLGEFESKTGFWLATGMGPVELYKL